METNYLRKILTIVVVVSLLVLSFFLLKPILLYIVFGFILAFIFFPIYNFLLKLTKAPNLSATIICIFLIVIILLPIWFFTPIAIEQGFKIYLSLQQTDFIGLLKGVFPSLFASEQFSAEVGTMIHSFVTKSANSLLNSLSKVILNFPTILLHSIVILFTLYFALRDKDKLLEYIKSLSPFSKDIEEKLFKSSRDITASVLYGQIAIGVLQGVIISIAFFIFGVPNALILSILAVVVGVIPIIGPMFVWIPVSIFLFLSGDTVAAIGILVFGLISSNIDNFLRPIFISKLTKLHSVVVLIGMIGGLFLFGVLGLILGPLILAYLLIILEVFRTKGSKREFYSALIKTD
ncbi:MAG: AI-2E family transporter [archaeon]